MADCDLCYRPHDEVDEWWACPQHGHEIVYVRSEDYQERHECPEPGCSYGRWI